MIIKSKINYYIKKRYGFIVRTVELDNGIKIRVIENGTFKDLSKTSKNKPIKIDIEYFKKNYRVKKIKK